MNDAEHIFRGKVPTRSPASAHASERREPSEDPLGERGEQVAAVAEGLRARGVARATSSSRSSRRGRGAGRFLAAASLARSGRAVHPDRPRSVVDRFARSSPPRPTFAVDGDRYGGKDFDRLETVCRRRRSDPSRQRIVVGVPQHLSARRFRWKETRGPCLSDDLGTATEMEGAPSRRFSARTL